MNEVTITFEDIGIDKYIQHSTDKKLGRMFENDAVSIKIIRPAGEENSNCFLIATDNNGKVLDQIDMSSNETKVKRHLSANYSINIGFSFSRDDGYVKNSSVDKYFFEKALDPNKTVEVEPEQEVNINKVVNDAFSNVVFDNTNLDFYNVKGKKVASAKIDISGGISNKEFVEELPTENIDPNTLYFLKKVDVQDNDYYDEYIYRNGQWEKIGSTKLGSTGVNPSLSVSYIELDTSLKTSETNLYSIPIKSATGDFEVYDELGNVDKYGAGTTAITHDYGEGNTYAGRLAIVGNGFTHTAFGYNEQPEIIGLILETDLIDNNKVIARYLPNLKYIKLTNPNLVINNNWASLIGDCDSLEEFEFPKTTTFLGNSFKIYNVGLKQIDLIVGNYFVYLSEMSNLKSINIPEGFSGEFVNIGSTSLENIIIPSTFTGGIGSNIGISSCTSLKTITLKANEVLWLSSVSDMPDNVERIFVPANLVSQYKTATNWISYADKIVAIDMGERFINNVSVTNFVEDTTYEGYGYKADIEITGVTADTYAEVVFSAVDSISGNYLPICETGDGIVTIYSKVNTGTVIPTIKV